MKTKQLPGVLALLLVTWTSAIAFLLLLIRFNSDAGLVWLFFFVPLIEFVTGYHAIRFLTLFNRNLSSWRLAK